MPIISSRPCMQPSSPKGPCSALKATSGFTSASCWATSRPTSISLTVKPSSRSALAQARPEVSETSRSDDQPPIRTATCCLPMAGLAFLHTDTADFPAQADAAVGLHALTHGLAEGLEIGRRGAAAIDQLGRAHV